MIFILTFMIELALTLLVCIFVTSYLRPHLSKVLLDLCRTQERGAFWTAFANILLIGFPVILALGFEPQARTFDLIFFELLDRLGANLGGYLFALAITGFMLAVFALFSPRAERESS